MQVKGLEDLQHIRLRTGELESAVIIPCSPHYRQEAPKTCAVDIFYSLKIHYHLRIGFVKYPADLISQLICDQGIYPVDRKGYYINLIPLLNVDHSLLLYPVADQVIKLFNSFIGIINKLCNI